MNPWKEELLGRSCHPLKQLNRLNTMKLITIDHCPVCQSKFIERVRDSRLLNNKTGGAYLKILALSLGINEDELFKKIEQFSCHNCKQLFYSPWLDKQSSSTFFASKVPDHVSGWNAFESLIFSGKYRSIIENSFLYELIISKIGYIDSYVEAECPFQGFLLYFKYSEESHYEVFKKFKKSRLIHSDKRDSRLYRCYGILNNFFSFIFFSFSYLKNRLFIKLNYFQSDNKVETKSNINSFPSQRFLYVKGRPNGWGINCSRFGNNCSFYAHHVLGASICVNDLNEKWFNDGLNKKISLFAMFNTLDHVENPIKYLEECLLQSSSLLIVVHKLEYSGKQHLFSLDSNFLQIINDRFLDYTVCDLTHEMAKNGFHQMNYWLITEKT